MPELRKSPLSKANLKENPIVPRTRSVVDSKLFKQVSKLSNGYRVIFDFQPLLNSCDKRLSLVYKLAHTLSERLKDSSSVETEYSAHIAFLQYCRYCNVIQIDPFTEDAFLAYCGQNGELQRRINLAIKPLPYAYLYPHATEIGCSEASASTLRGAITTVLKYAGVFSDRWLRDTPNWSSRGYQPTEAYSQNEFNQLLRRLNFIFFSTASQLISGEESGYSLDSVQAVWNELSNGEVQTITLKNTPPKIGSINSGSPFNVAMMCGYYLFCHYTNLNNTSILNVCHPIVESEHNQGNRTSKYITVKAWKGRGKQVVHGTFVESGELSEGEELPLEVDKRDGVAFIEALTKLSLLFNPETENDHPKLFYLLTEGGEVATLTSTHLNRCAKILACYSENRIHHAPYLIERFFEVVDHKTITTVTKTDTDVGQKILKETAFLQPKDVKRWALALAYASLRALTNVSLRSIYMPLRYSGADHKGNVKVSFSYEDGTSGELEIEARFVGFLERLEEYARRYNRVSRSKHHPNQILTPYLLPLGRKNATYQWNGFEYPISGYLTKIGIYSGEYLLEITAKRFRATSSNHNIDPHDGGLSVAASLLQNQLSTLHDHYLSGDITQNQVIASQAIDILHEYAFIGSLENAKSRVKNSRNIEVLEYDEWLALRTSTNPNGLFCGGEPTGLAKKEHRASQHRSKDMVEKDIDLKCYQYDKCIICQSAKLVNDVSSAYKLLSFIELLEDSIVLMPEREEEFMRKANELLTLAEQNLSEDVLVQAEDKLAKKGRYFLHKQEFLQTMIGVHTHA